jgi:hypothetical protein
MSKTHSGWSLREVSALREFKNKLFEAEERQIAEKILTKEDNTMSFYHITPKD